MKKTIYILLLLSLAFGLNGCGGSGSEDDEPETPKPQISFVLKSDITGIQDNGLKEVIKHIRLYIFDSNEKLLSFKTYTSIDDIKSQELTKGKYSIVLVGNVPANENISSETIGTSLKDMSVKLAKKSGAANYTPLGDVIFAKNTLTVAGDDTSITLSVKRTLSSTTVAMTDRSGKISNAGVLIPGVATTMGFSDSKWKTPGTVFVPMTATTAKSLARAEEIPKNYSASMNITVVKEKEEDVAPKAIQCNIVATNEKEEVIITQVFDVPVETRPNTEVAVNVEVKQSESGSGDIELSVGKVEVKDENGKQEEIPTDDIEVKITDVSIQLQPGDWETGKNEDIEFGEEEDYVRPGGGTADWEEGSKEEIVLEDTPPLT